MVPHILHIPRDHNPLPTYRAHPMLLCCLLSLLRVQVSISKVRLLGGRNNPQIRLPITPTILRRMKAVLDTSPCRERLVVWAIVCSAFFGFFRLGELLPTGSKCFNPAVDLAWGDVSLDNHDNPQMVQFHLKVSKCDQLGAGVDIVVGRTGKDLYPVAALVAFVKVRGSGLGPFFLDSAGVAITKERFVAEIRRCLESASLQQGDYAEHSFRIGAVTTAAMVGIC